jgi:hypothetical protein
MPPEPSNEHAVPITPVTLQYFMLAPFPVVGQLIVVGHVLFIVASQLTSQPHEVLHVTLPQAASRPVHVAVHLPVPQLIAPQAARPPLHVSVHAPPLQVIAALHALAPSHVRVQAPVDVHDSEPHTCWPPPPMQVSVQLPVVQDRLPHASAPLHAAVQSPLVQVILPHALTPVQSMLQSAVPHRIPRHASPAAQWTLHEVAFWQLIAPHAPAVGQVMSQFQFAGHVRLPLPVPEMGHSRVCRLHVVAQIEGHTSASAGRASTGRLPTTQ